MDRNEIERMILDAKNRGVIDKGAADSPEDVARFEIGVVPRVKLLGIYTKRLNRTGNDEELKAFTLSLVHLLENYPHDDISWLEIIDTSGRSRNFLADSTTGNILFHMKILDRPAQP
ncbi:hypothetical protein [Nocardia stercoris]|uniref:hypothetical protein n=1 Tax=Nocardia stercoris TaxID=2483361 RepID=UPI0011C3A50A|nr:hypothetical protein [Nocardia stercoris]